MRKLTSVIVFVVALMIGAMSANAQVVVDGNPNCASLGFNREFKIEPVEAGVYPVTGFGNLTLTVNSQSSIGFTTPAAYIRAVIMKGGPRANVYSYDPAIIGADLLTPPPFDGGGFPATSHVSFCYNIRPTAASVTISGRVFDAYGRPVSSARVATIDAEGNQVVAYTNTFGYYKLSGASITAGVTYVVQATHRRYTFGAQLVNASDNVDGLNFIAVN